MLLTLKPPPSGSAYSEYTVINQSTPGCESSTGTGAASNEYTVIKQTTPGCEMSTGPGSSMESSDKSTSQLSPVTQHAPSVPSPLPPHLHFSQGPEQMQHWLHAKAEEERRLQEEEKTRQETLKLEQRKVEQAILTDALRAGVPPYLVPTIFAGLNGDGRFCQASAAAHQCMAQMHQIAPGPAEIQKAFSTAGEASHVDVSPEKDCASTTQSLPPSRGSESHPSAHPDQTQPRAAMNESQPGCSQRHHPTYDLRPAALPAARENPRPRTIERLHHQPPSRERQGEVPGLADLTLRLLPVVL